jgi:methanethiol S-methyltransferase
VAALVVDVALVALFGLQHSAMARQGFKRWWTHFVPQAAERSFYVLMASAMLIVMFAFWRPIPAVVWATGGGTAIVASTFQINHFELFGLQQAWFNLRRKAAAAPKFRQPLFYKLVRHPLYTGFFIALWAAPVMTVGRFVLAGALSAWMLLAIRFEERDLIDVFGDQYVHYRKRVGMLLPRIRLPN